MIANFFKTSFELFTLGSIAYYYKLREIPPKQLVTISAALFPFLFLWNREWGFKKIEVDIRPYSYFGNLPNEDLLVHKCKAIAAEQGLCRYLRHMDTQELQSMQEEDVVWKKALGGIGRATICSHLGWIGGIYSLRFATAGCLSFFPYAYLVFLATTALTWGVWTFSSLVWYHTPLMKIEKEREMRLDIKIRKLQWRIPFVKLRINPYETEQLELAKDYFSHTLQRLHPTK